MGFSENLELLMNTFNTSNSHLAKGIHVDPSLVSRWRNGQRCPSENSPHILAIVNYFLNLETQSSQKIFFNRLMESDNRDEVSGTKLRHMKMKALMDWLVSDAEAPLKVAKANKRGSVETPDIVNSIANALVSSDKFLERLNSTQPIFPNEKGRFQGLNFRYELFRGTVGKRQAVLNFLNTVLASEKPLELLLTSEEDITWLTEDKKFLNLWASMLKAIIDQGHNVTVIHVVNRDISEILSILNYWMPLHLSGHLKSYYYPKYVTNPLKQTYFIIKDVASIVSYVTSDAKAENCSFYYNDSLATKIFEASFIAYLSQCKRLLTVYTPRDTIAFLEHWVNVESQPGCSYSIRNSFNSLFMPDNLYLEHLAKSPHVDGQHHQSLFNRWKEDFLANLEYYKCFDIMPASVIENIIYKRTYTHLDSKIFGDKSMVLNPSDIVSYLKNIVNALKRLDNYELFLTNYVPGLESVSVNILYKDNIASSFTTASVENGNSAAIVLDEGNILQALGYYFDDYIQQIPSSNRNKSEVIRKLEKAIVSITGRDSDGR